MRDPKRLDKFYDELKSIHKKYCPDWRFGQFMVNVLNSFNIDPFFPEEDKMIEMIKNFFEKKGE